MHTFTIIHYRPKVVSAHFCQRSIGTKCLRPGSVYIYIVVSRSIRCDLIILPNLNTESAEIFRRRSSRSAQSFGTENYTYDHNTQLICHVCVLRKCRRASCSSYTNTKSSNTTTIWFTARSISEAITELNSLRAVLAIPINFTQPLRAPHAISMIDFVCLYKYVCQQLLICVWYGNHTKHLWQKFRPRAMVFLVHFNQNTRICPTRSLHHRLFLVWTFKR